MCILDLNADESQLSGNLNEHHLNKLLMLVNKLAASTSLAQEKVPLSRRLTYLCISYLFFPFFLFLSLFSLFSSENSS